MPQPKLFVSRILDDEGLASGLNDPEKTVLVEWLVAQAERIAGEAPSESAAWSQVEQLCRRARTIGRLMVLLTGERDLPAATRLAAENGLAWPASPDPMDAVSFLRQLLVRESPSHP